MKKILLIEDLPDNAELVSRALSQSNYELLHAADAETGLEMAKIAIPDLILLDLGLPDYDGQTLAGLLREEKDLKKTKIVAITAWPEETARQMVSSYHCDGYISKPIIKIRDFISQVDSYLKTD